MKLVLSAIGSRGDVQPVAALALELQRRGHDVCVCVIDTFAPWMTELGLPHVTFDLDITHVLRNLGGGMRGLSEVTRWMSQAVDEQVEVFTRQCEGADALITGSLELVAASIAEHFRIPHHRMMYAPYVPGPLPPPLFRWQRLPGVINRGLWGLIQTSTEALSHKPIAAARQALGLPAVRSALRQSEGYSWSMLAIDPALAPAPDDGWGEQYSQTGYCVLEQSDELPADLVEFLEAGEEPIYIGFGSMLEEQPDEFGRMLAEVSERLGRRMVLGVGQHSFGDLPERIFPLGDASHQALFRRVAAVVHHGGSGTTHTAAHAGAPQLLVPHGVDQFYWGERVRVLGLGPRPLPSKQLGVDRLTGSLEQLLGDDGYRARAEEVAGSMLGNAGIVNAANWIEKTRLR